MQSHPLFICNRHSIFCLKMSHEFDSKICYLCFMSIKLNSTVCFNCLCSTQYTSYLSPRALCNKYEIIGMQSSTCSTVHYNTVIPPQQTFHFKLQPCPLGCCLLRTCDLSCCVSPLPTPREIFQTSPHLKPLRSQTLSE